MKTYFYKQAGHIYSTDVQMVVEEHGDQIASVARIYSNRLKKLVDGYFDYRYFVMYMVCDRNGEAIYQVKKIFRRGKVWFEARHLQTKEKYIISYENWRIGVPELFINGANVKMKIDKEMEDWSTFSIAGEMVARWKADYDEQANEFFVTLEVDDTCAVNDPKFYIGIAQATLFIGV